jgi:hypothetical protein
VSLGYKGGKRVRRKVTGRTKTEVRTKLRDLRRDLDNGVRSSATYTVGDALDDWLANGLSGRSDRTKDLYRDTVKPLRERLAEVKLRELTAGDVHETLDAVGVRAAKTRAFQVDSSFTLAATAAAAGLGDVFEPRPHGVLRGAGNCRSTGVAAVAAPGRGPPRVNSQAGGTAGYGGPRRTHARDREQVTLVIVVLAIINPGARIKVGLPYCATLTAPQMTSVNSSACMRAGNRLGARWWPGLAAAPPGTPRQACRGRRRSLPPIGVRRASR